MLRKYMVEVFVWLIIILMSFLTLFILVKLFPYYQKLIRSMGKIILPFMISGLIAYLLYPVKEAIKSLRVQTSLAIIIIYLFIIGTIGLFIIHSLPKLIIQMQELNEHLPELFQQYDDFMTKIYNSTDVMPEPIHEHVNTLFQKIEAKIEHFLQIVIERLTNIFDIIVVIAVTPVLVFYMLKDFEQIKGFVKKVVPKKYHKRFYLIARATDDSLGNYIRGQFIVCLFVGLSSWIAFEIINLNYAVFLAVIMGLMNIIPYFGPLLGTVPAVAIAATQSSELILFVIIAAIIVQLLENNLLSPFIVGKSVNIHPIGIILALLIGGQVAGVIGMVVVVPFVTICRRIYHVIKYDKENPLTYE